MGVKYKNRYDLETYNYGIGYTKNGQSFYFDKEDYDLIKDKCWHLTNKNSKNYCYVRSVCEDYPKGVLLHRLILNVANNPNVVIDHINHNGRDNRKINLRITTQQKNLQNTKLRKDNTTGNKGVYLDKRRGTWYIQITIKGKTYSRTGFKTKDEAIKVRKELEDILFDDFSYDNSKLVSQEILDIDDISNEKKEIRGVCFSNCDKKWRSYIQINKVCISLGTYDNYEDAKKARLEAEEKYLINTKENKEKNDLF